MANSQVPITAGSGTNIDTEVPTGGDHRQVVVIGDPNTTGGVAPVDATFGLEVDVSRVVPGTGATHLGKAEDTLHVDGDVGVMILGVREHYTGSSTAGDYAAISVGPNGDMNTLRRADMKRITVASTVLTTSTPSYTSGDQLGSLMTLADAGRFSGGGGIITAVTLVDATGVVGSCDVVFFDSSVTLTSANNDAFSVTDPDALKICGIAQLAGAISLSQNRFVQANGLYIPYVCSGGTSLFAAIITRSANAVFGSNSALQLTVYVERF